jgi:hypoxanthine phosphoribosyltransferase
MLNEIAKIQSSADLLHNEAEVERAIDKMAEKINFQLKDKNPVFLCVMNGGVVISGKLLTRLNFPLTFDAINASRYQNKTSGGEIQWIYTPGTSLKDRAILIVDDILDQGLTLQAIIHFCLDQGANSVYTAVLIDKKLANKKGQITLFFK